MISSWEPLLTNSRDIFQGFYIYMYVLFMNRLLVCKGKIKCNGLLCCFRKNSGHFTDCCTCPMVQGFISLL